MCRSTSFTVNRVIGCLLLLTLFGLIAAEDTTGTRQLLVVADNPSADVRSGSASSSVGEGIDIPAVQQTESTQDSVKPDSKQSKGQQEVLGRKGMPAMRQASQADLLPFCNPLDGVICADIDRYKILKSNPASFTLADTFPFFRVKPSLSYEGSSKSALDLLTDSLEDTTAGTLSTGLDVQAFDEQFSRSTNTTNTLASTKLNLGPNSSLKVNGDKTDVKSSFVWNSLKPLFSVVNGLPIGLQRVKDGSK